MGNKKGWLTSYTAEERAKILFGLAKAWHMAKDEDQKKELYQILADRCNQVTRSARWQVLESIAQKNGVEPPKEELSFPEKIIAMHDEVLNQEMINALEDSLPISLR